MVRVLPNDLVRSSRACRIPRSDRFSPNWVVSAQMDKEVTTITLRIQHVPDSNTFKIDMARGFTRDAIWSIVLNLVNW